jgi:hypothetical protein
MDNAPGMQVPSPFEARYLAFLETITQLRPRLHRYCSHRAIASSQRPAIPAALKI